MSDIQLREKIKTYYRFFALTIGLMTNSHFISVVVLFHIAALLAYSVSKIMTLDDIQPL